MLAGKWTKATVTALVALMLSANVAVAGPRDGFKRSENGRTSTATAQRQTNDAGTCVYSRYVQPKNCNPERRPADRQVPR